ncbi:CRTAC1 family protein [Hahella sp. CR1]|uniref:CRTAC1 family protein n=1 Tax=Hahella sp. CR1 TaxID=2992807 RepID=UPI0024431E07|nr:CRTAC1 family protein [Hahella sp. CR1]MDG9669820.1 CRTAC1 family protein [Hahella sp. CR1]
MKTPAAFSALLTLPFLLTGCAASLEDVREAPASLQLSPFTEVKTDFVHHWTQKVHPFSGAAVLDIDGDGKEEIFVGGGEGQDDALLSLRDGELRNIIQNTGLSASAATYGATAMDMNADGEVDLIIARNDGVYLYLNNGGRFTAQKLPVQLPDNTVSFAVTVSDIDQDGDGDLYISNFISFDAFKSATFNDPAHARANILLRNDGDLQFTDITAQSGTASLQNTFLSVFVDLNSDRLQDLVVAQNTGEVEIFKNLGDGRFESVPTHSGFGFWMGLAVGDIDRDGDQDLFFTNIGNSIPEFLTSGDLRDDQRQDSEWLLLRNEGDFRFTDMTEPYQLTGYGFGWGGVFEDINLDGEMDLLVAQNYIKWPIHKVSKLAGKAFLQLPTGMGHATGFFQADDLELDNPWFGQSPVIMDLNGDGRPDIVWLNMDGPVRAFLNTTEANFIALQLPDSPEWSGTEVTIEMEDARSYTRQATSAVGLMTDQSPRFVFGIGARESVTRIVALKPDGKRLELVDPKINTVLSLGE